MGRASCKIPETSNFSFRSHHNYGGENYCRYLIPLIELWGNKVQRPLKGLSMGFQPGRLRALTMEAKRSQQDYVRD